MIQVTSPIKDSIKSFEQEEAPTCIYFSHFKKIIAFLRYIKDSG